MQLPEVDLLAQFTNLLNVFSGYQITNFGTKSDVVACLEAQNIPYSLPGSPDWKNRTTPFNLRLQYEPIVVTMPNTSDDVGLTVKCAAASNLKVQAKGGGHSYASYSSGGQDGSLIISMEEFDLIEVDKSTYIAKIGAGQRLGNVASAIFDQAKRALPHGTCPGVGIAGHAIHGGYGYASRKWGISLDHIVGLDIVLANGTQIYTDGAAYSDIFYAMRGAGDSFGIVTYLYMQTEPAPNSVLYFSANLTDSMKDVEVITAGFKHLQDLALDTDLIISDLSYGVYANSNGDFIISGWCIECDIIEFSTNLFPTMLRDFSFSDITIMEQDWVTALEYLAAKEVGETLTQPLGTAYSVRQTFYAKSLVVSNARPLTTNAIRSFWRYMIANKGKGYFFTIINLYGGRNSAINIPSSDSSAYSNRDALWVFQNLGHTVDHLPPWDEELTAIVDGMNDAVTRTDSDGGFSAYVNYVDPHMSARQAAMEYYGKETYNKLLRVKNEIDPSFVFWNPQAIGLTPAL